VNLLADPWLPVIRRSGLRCTILPSGITDGHGSDPVMALDWPRPDFCVAGMELLTGLLATACPPDRLRDWLDRWEQPPDPDALAAAFAPLAVAFELDGDGPRFMQDREDLVSEAEPVEQLLIEAPGASTRSKNTDLLVRRGRVSTLGRAAAAMALYTFQSWAPAGGAGNRTGLRGGGPLVTMVLPGAQPTLWQTLWANVPDNEPAEPHDLPRIFPWLAPTQTSKEGRVVTPVEAHTLQCWWGMPRRIRLDLDTLDEPRPCGLTGVPDTVAVSTWRQRPHGPNYAAWGGVHPLTPTYQQKPGTERLALHAQPGGIGYRHWLGLVLKDGTGLRQPAPAISTWRDDRQPDVRADVRLLAAGFDMDNMKARGFVESTMPLPAAPDKAVQDRLDELARRLVLSAEAVAGMLRAAVRSALFSAGATVRPDLELLSLVRERLWADTEPAFFAALARPLSKEGREERDWHAMLRTTALWLFDEAAPMDPDVPPLVRQGETAPRLVRARRNLAFALQGFGKDGQALFETLGLPAAESRKGKQKKGKAP
jgi:CRISPR system Cascade subunit CasA